MIEALLAQFRNLAKEDPLDVRLDLRSPHTCAALLEDCVPIVIDGGIKYNISTIIIRSLYKLRRIAENMKTDFQKSVHQIG